ncbi:MAG: circularly permuted type 2 ATP-grasp protein [Bryobacteraceae bacterium]
MAQLDEAISRYHRILQSEPYRDLAWVPELRKRMEAEHLSAGGRMLCPFLRPHLLTRRQYDSLVRTAETLISAVDRMQEMVLATPALQARLELLPAEKMLASIDPGYKMFEVISRLDSHVTNGSLHLVQYNADSPSGVAWADALAEIFYTAPPVKEFRKRHKLARIGGKKPLLTALLAAYKQFGGRRKPRIGILEFRSGFAPAPSEFEIFREFFRNEGYETELVSPDQLEFRNDVLRRGNFEIDLMYRRVSVQEFLQRFDLTHPLVQAYRARRVCMVNSFRSELAHKKAFFGLLTDESLTAKFPAAEKKAIREHVPWTRLVAPGKTTVKSRNVDLFDYITKHRKNLVLKPNDDYGGQGAFFGWEMDDAAWERALQQSRRTPYVVQERVGPAKSIFPVETYGQLEFREFRVDVHPHAYLGRVQSCSSWLSTGTAAGYSSSSGLAPTFILEGSK